MIRFLQTKGKVQRVLLVGFLAIVCITLVISLVPGGISGDELGEGGDPNVLATVGSQEVTLREVQMQARNMARQQFPRGFPPQLMPFFMQRAADSLILQNVVLEEAKRLGLEATDQELRHDLQHGPLAGTLFPEGAFIGTDQYRNFVEQQFNMSIAQFEDLVKRDITVRKLRALIEGGVTVSDKEMQDEFRKASTKVKFDYAVISLDQLAKTVNPSEAELRAYYEKNQNQFENSIPEQRKARFIVIDPSKLPNAPKATDQDIQSYYQQHQDEYRVPESATVRHILIKTPTPGQDGKVDQKAVDAAKAKAEDVAKQVRGGANFAELAKKFSDDPGSKDKGGELGPITRGRTVPEFEQAAFGAKKGDIVGPVQTQYGFHIIQVQDKTEAHLTPMEQVRAQIQPIVERQKQQGAAEQLARTVEAQARTQGMEKAAAERGLQLVNTDFFTRADSIPGIGNAQAFADYVFGNQPNSPPTQVATPNGFVVAQVTEIRPARTPSFEEVRARIADQMRREQAQSMLQKKTQELSDKARAMHNLRAAAKEVGATVKTSDYVTPMQQIPDFGSLAAAGDVTRMNAGEISGPIPAGNSGAVIAILDKKEPTPAEFDQQKDQVREALLGQKRGELLQVYVASVRDRLQKDGKIRVNQQRMQQLASADQ